MSVLFMQSFLSWTEKQGLAKESLAKSRRVLAYKMLGFFSQRNKFLEVLEMLVSFKECLIIRKTKG